MKEKKDLDSMIAMDDFASLYSNIKRIAGDEELLSWFYTINKILNITECDASLVYKIIDRDKDMLESKGIFTGMDTYKIMNFIPIVMNTYEYLKENAGMFKDVKPKIKSMI